jgi:hypothetical protein
MAKVCEAPDGRLANFFASMLYLLACFLPCIDGGPDTQSGDPGFLDFEAGWHFGLLILLFGWGWGKNLVPWSANLLLVLGLICLGRKRFRAAFWLGILASILGLTTWSLRRHTPMIGYYVWQASLLMMAISAAFATRKAQLQEQ